MFTSLRYMSALIPALTASLIFAALAFGWNNLKHARPDSDIVASISVEGTHTATAKPDIGIFTMTLRAEEATQQAAQTKVAERETAILAYLAEQSVEEKDITTGSYDLSPQYEYQVDTNCRANYCPGKQVQTGYQVSQTITVKVRALDTAGELIAGVGARGAENVSGVTFKVDDLEKLREEALAAAIQDARTKAEMRADALGVRLGRVMSFFENSGPITPFGGDRYFKADAATEASVAPQLPTGESEYTVRVSVQFGIR